MFPKPARRYAGKRAEWESKHGVASPSRDGRDAIYLLECILTRLHVTGLSPGADRFGRNRYRLQLDMPEDLFSKLVLFGIESEDLEPETDIGIEDGPHDDIAQDREPDDEASPCMGAVSGGDISGLQPSYLFGGPPESERVLCKNLITGEERTGTRSYAEDGTTIMLKLDSLAAPNTLTTA